MYRQCLDIDPDTAAATDLRELHKFVMSGWVSEMTPAKDGERSRLNILFAAARQRRKPSHHRTGMAAPVTRVLVQGSTPPRWDRATPGIITKVGSIATYNPTFTEGEPVEIAFTGQPTICQNGRHKPIRDPHKIAEWAVRQLAPAAVVDITSCVVADEGKAVGGSIPIHFNTFIAPATITHPDIFQRLLIEGIGRGKAFGAGLLRVRSRN